MYIFLLSDKQISETFNERAGAGCDCEYSSSHNINMWWRYGPFPLKKQLVKRLKSRYFWMQILQKMIFLWQKRKFNQGKRNEANLTKPSGLSSPGRIVSREPWRMEEV